MWWRPATLGSAAIGLAGSTNLERYLENLAGRVLRQTRPELHLAGIFVRRHSLLDVADELLGGDRGSGLEFDEGFDLFAQQVIGHADDRRLRDRGVGVQHLFDLAGVDVVAAPDDEVLLAVDDEEVAVLVAVS